jgi:pimeloyl-ACP methyl ester carboxylesterase
LGGGGAPNLAQIPGAIGWSGKDRKWYYLDGERMRMSGRFVKGSWRYEQIDGASHWIPLDASDRLNQLLIEWLG